MAISVCDCFKIKYCQYSVLVYEPTHVHVLYICNIKWHQSLKENVASYFSLSGNSFYDDMHAYKVFAGNSIFLSAPGRSCPTSY